MARHPSLSSRPFPVSRLARFELRRFRGRVPKLALVFVLIVPLLYGAIYLTANWDPYGRLDRLPVAVVNHDRPATANGRPVTAGADLVANLHRDAAFDWHDVGDDQTAADGLANGAYYLTLTIPADFSADLVSGQGNDPQRAAVELRRDDANGFVVGNITNTAQGTIERAVDASAQQSYFDAVFANLASIRTGLTDAADGAGRLADGIDDAESGAGKLATGSKDAAAGARRLSSGATSLATGLDQAETGAASLSTGLNQLDTASGTLADGARDVARGTQRLDDTVVPPLRTVRDDLDTVRENGGNVSQTLVSISNLAAGASDSVASDLQQADTALDTLRRDHPELADDPAFQRIDDRVSSASTRAGSVAEQAKRADTTLTRTVSGLGGDDGLRTRIDGAIRDLTALNAGAQRVADGAATLHTRIGEAATGASTLSTGITKASSGADSLATGAASLVQGLDSLQRGAAQLQSGLGKLGSGADSLRDQLAKGAARIPTLTADQRADAVQVLSAPAAVTTTVDHAAGVYGRGLAPLFLSIALWVFGISVFLVVRPINARSLVGRASPLRLALAGWLPVATIAVAASWLMVAAVWWGLGLDPLHPWRFLGLTTLAALAFSAIAHLLRTALGTVGSSLLLVLLILQLSSAGGTYPGPLLPGFFAAIGRFLPMTYLIDAYRITISGGLDAHLVRDVLVLAAVLAALLGLTVAVVARRRHLAFADLHPPLTAP